MPRRGHQPWYKWITTPGRLTSPVSKLAGIKPLALARFQRSRIEPSPEQNIRLRQAYVAEQTARLRHNGFNYAEARHIACYDPKDVKRAIETRRLHAAEMVFKFKTEPGMSRSKWYNEIRKMLAHMAKKEYKASEWAAFSEFYAKHANAKRGDYFKAAKASTAPPPPPLTEAQIVAWTNYELKRMQRKRKGLPPPPKFVMPKPVKTLWQQQKEFDEAKKTGRRFPAFTGKPVILPKKGERPRVLSIREKARRQDGTWRTVTLDGAPTRVWVPKKSTPKPSKATVQAAVSRKIGKTVKEIKHALPEVRSTGRVKTKAPVKAAGPVHARKQPAARTVSTRATKPTGAKRDHKAPARKIAPVKAKRSQTTVRVQHVGTVKRRSPKLRPPSKD